VAQIRILRPLSEVREALLQGHKGAPLDRQLCTMKYLEQTDAGQGHELVDDSYVREKVPLFLSPRRVLSTFEDKLAPPHNTEQQVQSHTSYNKQLMPRVHWNSKQ
jgi:hypothetical protein